MQYGCAGHGVCTELQLASPDAEICTSAGNASMSLLLLLLLHPTQPNSHTTFCEVGLLLLLTFFFFQVCSSIYTMVPPMLYSYYQFSPIRITYARSLVSIIAISYSNIDNELYYQDNGDTFNILITPPTTTSPLPSLTEPTYIQAYIHSNRYRNKCIRICMSAYVCTPDLAVHDTYYLHTWIFQYTTLGVGTP